MAVSLDGGEIRERIIAKAHELGFDAVGIAPADAIPGTGKRLAEFLRQGRHGDMAWMASHFDRRSSPRGLWPDANSVIMLGVNYTSGPGPLAPRGDPSRGAISVYARGRDYHDVIKKRLKALARWICQSFDADVKVFVDTAPVLEKPLAQQAGLGWQGKHTNLVSRKFGSWLFLGSVFTTLELPADSPHADRCGACHRCHDVCPTHAFPGPFQLDARRCISYLTIEHKGHIATEFRTPIGNRVYGCDDCLAICPWNKFAKLAHDAPFLPRAELTGPRLNELVRLDDQAFRQLFRGTPVKRLGRDRFIRNVLIAIGNSGDAGHLGAVEALLADPSSLVRAMAIWALGRLAPRQRFAALADCYASLEQDPEVRAEWRSN
ncbi:MAG: tRNA epoxyqueuosine(34) reductase QueG [Sphingomonadales bacterium]